MTKHIGCLPLIVLGIIAIEVLSGNFGWFVLVCGMILCIPLSVALTSLAKGESSSVAEDRRNVEKRHSMCRSSCYGMQGRAEKSAGSAYRYKSYESEVPNRNIPRRRGSADYEWCVGAIVNAGFHKNCMVMEIHDNPLHYYLHTSRGSKITFFPHHGIHSGWVDYF